MNQTPKPEPDHAKAILFKLLVSNIIRHIGVLHAIGIVTIITALSLLQQMHLKSVLFSIALTCTALIAFAAAKQFLREVKQRSLGEAQDTQDISEWSVIINDVTVAQISDKDYTTILHKNLTDPRLFIHQFLNVAYSFLFSTIATIRAFPLLVLLMVVFGIAFPKESTEILLEIKSFTIPQLQSLFVSFFQIIFATTWTIVGFCILIGSNSFGFNNVYKQAIARDIRRRFSISTLGLVSLEPYPSPAQEQARTLVSAAEHG